MPKLVAYYRVSTEKQGRSGLGLEGQKAAVSRHVAGVPGGKLVGEYVEVETGKDNERPQLAVALAHAKSARAVLVVAKLDRLSRNLAFLAVLMDSGCDFVACDNPNANRLTLHILAAIAEHEAKIISERTKAALTAAKARGTALGSARPGHWSGREARRLAGLSKARVASADVRRRKAKEQNQLAISIICGERAKGSTWKAIADTLNASGHVSGRGRPWSAQTCRQLAIRECGARVARTAAAE